MLIKRTPGHEEFINIATAIHTNLCHLFTHIIQSCFKGVDGGNVSTMQANAHDEYK